VAVVLGLAVVWRPLPFVSADPEVAVARGVPAGRLSVVFALLLALAAAMAVQVVGALLVLALLVTPAAAAFRVTASPLLAPVLSVAFAVVSAVGGILLALGSTVPISPFVTTISFAIYLACRFFCRRRGAARRGVTDGGGLAPVAGDVEGGAVTGSAVAAAAAPGEGAR
jgi:zinc/manganese transport system permease protein